MLANQADLLKRLPEEVEKERQRLLEPVKEEILKFKSLEEKAYNSFKETTGEIEKHLIAKEKDLSELTDDFRQVLHRKEVLQQSVTTLDEKILQGNSEIIVATSKFVELQANHALLQERHTSLIAEVDILERNTQGLGIQKDALEREIAQIALDNELKTKESTDKLSIINLKLGESIKRLQETQRTEESTRTELATRTIALDKREEVLVNRENSLKIQEARVYNYAKAMQI